MQREILATLVRLGKPVDTDELIREVGIYLGDDLGRDVILDLGICWCWQSKFSHSFYRALQGLEKRQLITWSNKGHGRYHGMITIIAGPTLKTA